MNSVRFFSFPILSVIVLTLAQLGNGQGMAPSPSPAGPSNDGEKLDSVFILFFFYFWMIFLLLLFFPQLIANDLLIELWYLVQERRLIKELPMFFYWWLWLLHIWCIKFELIIIITPSPALEFFDLAIHEIYFFTHFLQ